MSVSEDLEAMRESVEGCRLVAFADIDAQLVLVSSSAERASRETLDALCAEAEAVFAAADAGAPGSGLAGADLAVLATGESVRLFLRKADGSDALCCVAEPGADLDALNAAARRTLPKLVDATGPSA